MSSPKVSVVIPAYNQAQFLGEAIQSVLNQSYQNFEVIIVNDASLDNTSEVVQEFNNPRIKLIVHEQNKGLPASRNTGMRASSGELIAFLDADDLFLPEKLNYHADFFSKHPDVGVSYNARFELNHSANSIREIWRPPQNVGLLDVVLGFPFSPSDMVIRREWAFRVDLFDESFVNGGEDTDFPCRLALAGCKFIGIDKVLNARRYHSDRKRKNLIARLQDVVRALDATFIDPRCTTEVLAIKDKALVHHLMVLVALAFIQEETSLGHQFLGELIGMDASILEGEPSKFVEFILLQTIVDDKVDHGRLLENIAEQLPDEYAWISNQFYWAVGRGYLIKGMRAIMFGRANEGCDYFKQAVASGAQLDNSFLSNLSYHLVSYAKEFGDRSAQCVIRDLIPYLAQIGNRYDTRQLQGNFYITKAYQDYAEDYYRYIPYNVLRGIIANPIFLANRGVLKILIKSVAPRIF